MHESSAAALADGVGCQLPGRVGQDVRRRRDDSIRHSLAPARIARAAAAPTAEPGCRRRLHRLGSASCSQRGVEGRRQRRHERDQHVVRCLCGGGVARCAWRARSPRVAYGVYLRIDRIQRIEDRDLHDRGWPRNKDGWRMAPGDARAAIEDAIPLENDISRTLGEHRACDDETAREHQNTAAALKRRREIVMCRPPVWRVRGGYRRDDNTMTRNEAAIYPNGRAAKKKARKLSLPGLDIAICPCHYSVNCRHPRHRLLVLSTCRPCRRRACRDRRRPIPSSPRESRRSGLRW